MPVFTRKQQLAFEAAQATPPQAGKRVRTAKDLQALVSLVALIPAHGAYVDSIDINLPSAFLPSTLRAALKRLPNLTDLVLITPRLRGATVLRDIRLPQLQYLRTDLPHPLLVGFLAAHPTITELDLVGDSYDSSALCAPQAANLSGLTSLSGPASYVGPLAPPSLTRLTMYLYTPRSTTIASLLKIDPPLPHLCTLILDFCDDEVNILDAIVRACPSVRKLKLIEKPSHQKRGSVFRRAYNDARAWAGALKKLKNLEELLLRTSSPLVRKPADWNDEHKLVTSWVNGIRQPGAQARAKPHPMLYHIGVWYAFGSSGGGSPGRS